MGSRVNLMPIRDRSTHRLVTLAFPVAVSAEETITRLEETLASEVVVQVSPPGATLDSPALMEIPDTPLAALMFIPSPAFTSATLTVGPASLLVPLASPQTILEALAIHQDPSAALAVATISSRPA